MELTPLRLIILISTAVQCYNYVMLGVFKRRQQRPWLFVLTCYCMVEAYWAYYIDSFMWLYVMLNVVGIMSFIKGGNRECQQHYGTN